MLPDRESYWLSRFLIFRLLGVVYAIAFLVAAKQILRLIGADGLLPVGNFLEHVRAVFGGSLGGFLRLPSIFWFNSFLFVLWILYMSFVHVGQEWYGYGWEVQLLETGLLPFSFVLSSTDAHFPSVRRRSSSSGFFVPSFFGSCSAPG